MARLFPFRSDPAENEGQPRVVDLEGEDADAVFGALSSGGPSLTTARRIYARIDEEPGTPSDIAEAIDSSIQNVRYHLEKLENAGLVEVVDTWYSSRGNEMSVYATTDGPLIVTSDESAADRLREALSRFVGGIGALAGGSLLVQYGLTRWAESAVDSSGPTASEADDESGPDGSDGSNEADETGGTDDADETAGAADESGDDADVSISADEDSGGDVESTDSFDGSDNLSADADGNGSTEYVTDGGADVAETIVSTVPPGLLFFLGGLVVMLVVAAYWYWYRYRSTY